MAIDEVKVVKPDARYRDFDAAIGEDEALPIVIMLKGREYTLTADLPAAVVLGQLRHLTEEGTLPTQYVPEWLTALVGQENMDMMLLDGMSWKQLESLTQFLLEEYGVVAPKTGDEDSPPE